MQAQGCQNKQKNITTRSNMQQGKQSKGRLQEACNSCCKHNSKNRLQCSKQVIKVHKPTKLATNKQANKAEQIQHKHSSSNKVKQQASLLNK